MNSRKYHSELREAQAQATRDSILHALVEVLAEGVDTLSIPAVAKRAGVSVGTVYRHFGDKAGLLDALLPYAGRRTGLQVESIPETMDEFDAVMRRVFQHFEDTDDLTRAAFASRIGRRLRVEGSGERLDLFRQSFRKIEPRLDEDQLEHVARLGMMLTTSGVYHQWSERLELGPDGVADEVMWTIKTVIKGLLT